MDMLEKGVRKKILNKLKMFFSGIFVVYLINDNEL